MYATDFEYDNKRLSDFDCITCAIDKSSGVEEINIGCDITFNTVKNNHSSIHSETSSSYEDVYNTSFLIAKNCCAQEERYFTHEEARRIVKWLNRRVYRKFKPLPYNDEFYDVHYYGSFNIEKVFIAGKIALFTLHFTGNAPYGFGEDNYFQITISEENETFSIYGDSDEVDTVIYPKVQIRCLADGNLKITNQTTDNYVYIKNCVAGETITIDGEYKITMTDNERHEATFFSDFNYGYLDIAIGEDENFENIYEVSLPCEITITYSPIRKVGV